MKKNIICYTDKLVCLGVGVRYGKINCNKTNLVSCQEVNCDKLLISKEQHRQLSVHS